MPLPLTKINRYPQKFFFPLIIIKIIQTQSSRNIDCNCNSYISPVDCSNFECQWNHLNNICSEYKCNQRTQQTCLTYNQLPRLANDPIFCYQQNTNIGSITCSDTPTDCQLIPSTQNQSCLQNLCLYNATQSVCQTNQKYCSNNQRNCTGSVVLDRIVTGQCYQDSSYLCYQINPQITCNTLTSESICIRINNCQWLNNTCNPMRCQDRNISSCDLQIMSSIYQKCVLVENQCHELDVENLQQNNCIRDSTSYWNISLNKCLSCNTQRWTIDNYNFTSYLTSSQSSLNSDQIVVISNSSNVTKNGQTFTASNSRVLLQLSILITLLMAY